VIIVRVGRDKRGGGIVSGSTVFKTDFDGRDMDTVVGREIDGDDADGTHSGFIGKVFDRFIEITFRIKAKENDFDDTLMGIDGTKGFLDKGGGTDGFILSGDGSKDLSTLVSL